MLKLKLKSFLNADFLRKEDGAIALEAMIIMPVLFWVYMASFSIYDAYRQYGMHQKAAYTISDMVSRETLAIDAAYLNGAHQLFDAMTRDPQDSTIRVTVVHYDAANDRLKMDWSKTEGRATPLAEQTVRSWSDKLPKMVDGERMILVETFAYYDPPFRTGLEDREITNFIFTRPRYAPQVLWSDGPAETGGV